MKKQLVLALALTYCVMFVFTEAQTYTPTYEDEYEEQQPSYTPSYGEEEEEEEQPSYTPSYEEEEEEQPSYTPSYGEEEEEQYYEEEEYEQNSYTYGGQPSYEEEYEEAEIEGYNYDTGSYAGNQTYSYGGNSSYGYGNNQGYTGSYNSNSGSPNSSPAFPTSLLTGFVVDIHFLAVDIHFQYIAYHYCSDLFPGYSQCAIYNGTDSNSRLVATEIVVSGEILATLPIEERRYYHSHAYSVKNGFLILPGVPESQQIAAYTAAANTYGKVIDYWHSFQDFPSGPPRLAYGLADDSQVNLTIVQQMDRALNLNTTWQERRRQRQSIPVPDEIEGVNDYLTTGRYPQFVTQTFNAPSNTSNPSGQSNQSGQSGRSGQSGTD